MKNRFLYLVCAASAVLSCTGRHALEFVQEQGEWIPKSRSVIKFTERLRAADAASAAVMLDEAFAKADSLSALSHGSRTVAVLSDALFAGLTGFGASQHDCETAEMMLGREVLCSVLDPFDFKRIDYKRGRLALNRPGYQINDIPVKTLSGEECMLRELFTQRTLLFVYGGACDDCGKMMREIRKSSFIRKAASDGSLNLIALYAGEDDAEFAGTAGSLCGWTGVCDKDGCIMYENAFDSALLPSFYLVSENGIVDVKAARSLADIEEADALARRKSLEIQLDADELIWGGEDS